MAKITLGNFRVEVDCEKAGSAAKRLSINSSGNHRVTVENLTTLPYDVTIECHIPDPQTSISYATAPTDRWTDQVMALSGLTKSPHLKHALDVHGPVAARQRLQFVQLKYRHATGLPAASTYFWQPSRSSQLPLTTLVDVV